MGAGRPTTYDPKYCQAIIDFFDVEPTRIIYEKFYYKNGDKKQKEVEVANELPTFTNFAHSIGVCRDTLQEWAKVHPEFSASYKKAKELQEAIWQRNALKGLYNPAFAIFMGKNVYGWKDKQEIDQNMSITEMPVIKIDGKPKEFDLGD